VINPRRASFLRYCVMCEVWLNGQQLAFLPFYGADRRTVRAEAKAWAKSFLAKKIAETDFPS